MSKVSHTIQNRLRRQNRTRATLHGTAERPRMSVFISHTHVSVQLIDDVSHKTLLAISTVGRKDVKGNLTERAVLIGAEVGKQAKAAKIKAVVFDRGSKLYHGRIKALADAARAEGLEF